MTLDFDLPWVEKYRPQNFNDIVSQSIAINSLKNFINSGNMPHMIFTGPAGTGKTSTALIIAKTLFKKDIYYRNVLELNASDTMRMDYVRNVLKSFVNQSMIKEEDSLKLVILDEADNIPNQVQQALRRIIERTSNRVKFILICNYINRIIDPIISRCAVFRFVKLPEDIIINRLKFIAKKEKLAIPVNKEKMFFDVICYVSANDLRKAINTLQMSIALELLENLDIDEILKVSGFADKKSLEKLIDSFHAKDFKQAREIYISFENLDSRNFIRQLIGVLPHLNLENKKANLLRAYFGDIDYRISQGADEEVQIMALLADIIDKVSK